MKKSRYTEEQIAYTLRLASQGRRSRMSVGRRASRRRRSTLDKKFGSLGMPEVRELRQMREENARLKRLNLSTAIAAFSR